MRRVLPAAVFVLAAFALPGTASAYGWPLKPFDKPHPIVGNLNDPRYGRNTESFHFGIDIAAPGFTPVYAVAPGRARLRPLAVSVVSRDGRVFEYWHVFAAVHRGERVALHQLLGWVNPREEHLHFAEYFRKGPFLNPLRAGGLTPYLDTTPPQIVSVAIERYGVPVDPADVTGAVSLIVDAYDTPSVPAEGPWAGSRVTPAYVRWRLVDVTTWQTAVDFRYKQLPSSDFWQIYAPGTRQNLKGVPGGYRFYLQPLFFSDVFANGDYRLEVEVSDIRGNTATSVLPFRIDNL